MTTFLINTIVPFMCGMVVTMNLTHLIETNPTYDAAWWKVGLAVLMTLSSAVYSHITHKTDWNS